MALMVGWWGGLVGGVVFVGVCVFCGWGGFGVGLWLVVCCVVVGWCSVADGLLLGVVVVFVCVVVLLWGCFLCGFLVVGFVGGVLGVVVVVGVVDVMAGVDEGHMLERFL
ncbi:hypothetical protein RA274_27715, partial [Pseudomonas syringae pv. tagetis]|uniref:hypothetical protein n=1 Tax=Pseudomonas syringae group genomosp. 7 TaxID=251699 RepID=UPI00376FB2BB